MKKQIQSQKSNKFVTTCPGCNHKGCPILKMGGLICAACRRILKYPYEPEYAAFPKTLKDEK